MSEMMHQEIPTPMRTERAQEGRVYRPDVDIVETPELIVIRANVPGAEASEISVDFEDERLEISAPVKQRQSGNIRYLVRQYGIGTYRRAFEIHERIDAEKISAEYVNGVLTVSLPKSEAVKPRKITVRGNA